MQTRIQSFNCMYHFPVRSHKAWVSSVRWSPTDPFVLASTSHDGTLKVSVSHCPALYFEHSPSLRIKISITIIIVFQIQFLRCGISDPIYHCTLLKLWIRRMKRHFAWHLEMELFTVEVVIVLWNNLLVSYAFECCNFSWRIASKALSHCRMSINRRTYLSRGSTSVVRDNQPRNLILPYSISTQIHFLHRLQ